MVARWDTLEKRFWSKVNKTDTCWLWTGTISWKGYGLIAAGKTNLTASRVMLQWKLGRDLEPGECALHTCDVRNCVNPEHLWIGTPKDNTQDAVKKGRFNGMNSRLTHCKKGHPYLPDNLRINATGWRVCKICARAAHRRWVQRNTTNDRP